MTDSSEATTSKPHPNSNASTQLNSSPKTSIKTKVPKRPYAPIIEVIDAYKHYGIHNRWRMVLKKFNMSVYKGEIYTLLGPHGCGKSTVLNSVLGFKGLNQGEVNVFGFPPGHELSGIPGIRVGYTPQSHGLYTQLTTNEILRYFARLLDLNKDYVDKRIAFLSDLLDLPYEKVHIKFCSEGIKRRISFAIALLHEPELLILDEPTAGVDPVLKKSMWEHLEELSKSEDKTVLVSTQNCIEARDSDRVGIMHNGRIALCGNARELLSKYQTRRVETIYMQVYALRLNPDDESVDTIQENPMIIIEPLQKNASEGFLYIEEDKDKVRRSGQTRRRTKCQNCTLYCRIKACSIFPNCSRLCVIILKDFCCSFRKYFWLVLLIVIPALFVLIFGYTVGRDPVSLTLAVINNETAGDCKVNYSQYMSCQVLNIIDPKIKLIPYKTIEEGRRAVKNMDAHGVLAISDKFTMGFSRLFMGAMPNIMDGHPSNLSIDFMHLSMDVSNKVVSSTLQFEIENALNKYVSLATAETNNKEIHSAFPLTVDVPIVGTVDAPETNYMLLGLAIIIIYYTAAFISSITLIRDRIEHIFQRDYIAGVQLIEIVLSIMIVHGFLILVEVIVLFLIILFAFEESVQGQLWYLVPIIIMHIWCGLCFGILISTLTKSTVCAGTCIFCFVIASIILCGVLGPLESLPLWLQTTVKYFPHTYAISATRNIILRGLSITNPRVFMGVLIPLGWLIIFIFLSILINKVSY